MSHLPSIQRNDHSRGAGRALRCGGIDRGHFPQCFPDPAERLPSLWRIPKRQQLGGAQLSRSATFYSNCARADLPRMRIGDGGFPSLKATVATLTHGGPSRGAFVAAPVSRLNLCSQPRRQALADLPHRLSRLSSAAGFDDHSKPREAEHDALRSRAFGAPDDR